MSPSREGDEPVPSVEDVLDSRRIRERLLHLRSYREESPEEGIRVGLALSAAAIRSREAGGS